jgi:uncharacterized membrane protein required for colicin V production
MVAAVIQKTTPWWQHFAFNWFDVAVVVLLALGFWRGRKRGMTKELLPFLQWLAILLGAGFGHVFLADWLTQQGLVKYCFGNSFKERTAALMSGYLLIAVAVFIVFVVLRRKFLPKLEGSSFFGGNEYYWGIPAGVVRYACMMLVALALLNAPLYSQADITAAKAYNNRWYGGGMKDFSGDFIPSVDEVQVSVFKESLLGPFIKDNLSLLLINTVQTTKKPGQH